MKVVFCVFVSCDSIASFVVGLSSSEILNLQLNGGRCEICCCSMQIVAIKKLDLNGRQGIREFAVEVLTLSRADHPNLVKLIGYCVEGDQRLLVYEYMPLGSLEDHLYGMSWTETCFHFMPAFFSLYRLFLLFSYPCRACLVHRNA